MGSSLMMVKGLDGAAAGLAGDIEVVVVSAYLVSFFFAFSNIFFLIIF